MQETTDHQLMLSVRTGDIDKLGPLFERYHKQLYIFFLRQTGDSQTSEDLVQDVFYRILKYRDTYRGTSKFMTWMFSIAHNSKNDHYRKKKQSVEPIDDGKEFMTGEADPEQQSIQKNNIELLKTALADLQDEKREALILSRFHNMKYDEIAEVMGCKVGTIKARIHWAIKDISMMFKKAMVNENGKL